MTSEQAATLRVTEIFHSLQGEAATAGWPTVFVRLTGCPMRCTYCDTAYAFEGGEILSLEDILQTVEKYTSRHVTVTGGEPLAQPNCLPLLTRLCDAGYQVSLETGGALPIAPVDKRVSRVLDIKTPGSGEEAGNRPENLAALRHEDQLKFVITSRADYEWSRDFFRRNGLAEKVRDIWFSPAYGEQPAEELADWILQDRLPVRFQVQLHKVLWGDARGR